ncbi:MAG: hypothetical protein ABGZ53_13495 [Fuerstiella sp.]
MRNAGGRRHSSHFSNSLRQIILIGIADIHGDRNPLLNLERLRSIGTEDKKHYNQMGDDIIEMLVSR